jgi:hypothetical protein
MSRSGPRSRGGKRSGTGPRREPVLHPAELAIRLNELRREVEPLVPGVDPGDLLLILENMLRGPGSGRALFLRQARRGVYVV